MKKTIFIVLLFCLVVSLTAIPTVAMAETTTTVANTTALQDVVAEKLGPGDYTYELLAGFSEPDRYTLVEGDNKYLIFDNVLQKFVEYSDNGNSAYYDLPSNATKMYLGPTYYYYQQGGAVIDMENGQQLDESAVAACALYEQESLVSRFSIQQSSQPSATAYQTQAMDNLTDAEKMAIYFSNLNWNMGLNDGAFTNSCSIVAMGMMLSYFDTFRDDNIIDDEEFDVDSKRRFNSFSEISMADFEESPGVDTRFQQYLINMAIDLGVLNEDASFDWGILNTRLSKLLKYYFEVRGIPASVAYKFDLFGLFMDFEDLMSKYGPLMLCITVNANNFFGTSFHYVVAYQYSNGEIMANYGSQGFKYNAEVSRTQIIGVHYVQFEEGYHSCSNNYGWLIPNSETGSLSEGSTGTLCPCGKIICKHENNICQSIGDTGHKYVCNTCGVTFSTGKHTFTTTGTGSTCSECSYTIQTHSHKYTYIPAIINNMHNKVCTVCGLSTTENCTGLANPDGQTVCRKCGRVMGGIILNSVDEQEEQIADTLRGLASAFGSFQVISA